MVSPPLEARAALGPRGVRSGFGVALAALVVGLTLLDPPGGHTGTATRVLEDLPADGPLRAALSVLALAFAAPMLLRLLRRSVPPVVAATLLLGVVLTASGLLGVRPALSPAPLLAAVVLAALLLLARDAPDPVRTVRNVLLGVLVANVVFALARPDVAVQTTYVAGVVPWRLHGLSGHANSLGPLMVLLLVTLVLRPLRTRGAQTPALLGAAAALLATQSKTALLTLLLVALVGSLPAGRAAGRAAARRLHLHVGLLLVTLAVLTGVATLTGGETAARLLADEDVVTLTGRTDVWQATLSAWRESPLFGVGGALWDDRMREDFAARYGWSPAYAHNLWLQVLGQAGLVGLATLLLYLLILLGAARRHPRPALAASLVLGFLVLRGVSEVTVGNDLWTDNTLAQLLVTLLVSASTPTGSRP